ncbi:MAG: DUF1598 domain-containing protein [Planctomycetaceae bacterium]
MPSRYSFYVALVLMFAATSTFAQVGGISIDSQGMLRNAKLLSLKEQQTLLGITTSGRTSHAKTLKSGSSLRKISLRKLEAELKRIQLAGKTMPAEIQFLAGLTNIRYIVFLPLENDVILAGPAENWKAVPTGEIVGVRSGRPVLHLDDLLVALRYSFTEKDRPPFMGCSIDPTPEGMKRYARYLNAASRRFSPARLKRTLAEMQTAMGPQTVTLYGVPSSSRFALVMLAADYRLKRIAMGHERSPHRNLQSYLDLVASKTSGAKAIGQHRFWFRGECSDIRHTADLKTFEIADVRLLVATAPASQSGETSSRKNPRRKSRKTSPSRKFCEIFTKSLPEVEQRIPVFAEVRNLMTLGVVAELIAKRYYGEKPFRQGNSWSPTYFLNRKKCRMKEFSIPKYVPSLANTRFVRGTGWLFSVSGGVELNPSNIVKQVVRMANEKELMTLNAVAGSSIKDKKTHWWWDESNKTP